MSSSADIVGQTFKHIGKWGVADKVLFSRDNYHEHWQIVEVGNGVCSRSLNTSTGKNNLKNSSYS